NPQRIPALRQEARPGRSLAAARLLSVPAAAADVGPVATLLSGCFWALDAISDPLIEFGYRTSSTECKRCPTPRAHRGREDLPAKVFSPVGDLARDRSPSHAAPRAAAKRGEARPLRDSRRRLPVIAASLWRRPSFFAPDFLHLLPHGIVPPVGIA